MGIAIVGLIAGAREQFMKLDTFFGLLAVLVLGFSADSIKNVFSKKPFAWTWRSALYPQHDHSVCSPGALFVSALNHVRKDGGSPYYPRTESR
jgi:hypothetical protein